MSSVAVSQAADFQSLHEIALQSLRTNTINLPSGRYVRAGAHQFQSVWSRDFWGSIPGLLASGDSRAVHDTLRLLLDHVRASDHLVPRLMDSTSIQKRYILKFFRINPPLKDPLRAEYKGGSNADQVIDSNLCVILGLLDYTEKTGDRSLWQANHAKIQSLLDYYTPFLRDGLIDQPPYSDWQDSVPRKGHTLYTNVMYWSALSRLATLGELGVTRAQADAVKNRIWQVFYDPATGLWRSLENYSYISSDGLLMLLDYGFLDPEGARQTYVALQHHPLWWGSAGVPGFWGFPDYPASWTPWTIRLAGLQHYSDSLYSSNLMAWYAKIAYKMGDFENGDRILERLQQLVVRDQTVEEIYNYNSKLGPVRRLFYRSERPFTWGAAKILETLEYRSSVER